MTEETSTSTSGYSEYLQNYQVGVRGFLFSRGFFSYYLGTRFQDSQRRYDSSFMRIRSINWYDFTGTFFSNRRVGFETFLKRTQTDLLYTGGVQRRYDDLIGGEVRLLTRWLPTTRAGYRLINSRTVDQGNYRTHLSTLNMQAGVEGREVEMSFRDEQRTSPYALGISRTQQLSMKGLAEIWSGSTTMTGEVNYTGHNAFKATQASLRMLGRYRQRDRLFVLYAFNTTQNSSYANFTNSLQGDYRRYLSEKTNLIFKGNLLRSLSRWAERSSVAEAEDLAAGAEYLDQKQDSLRAHRWTGQATLNFQNNEVQGSGGGVNASGAVEWRRFYAPLFQITHSYNLAISYIKFPQETPYFVNHRYLLELGFRPAAVLTFSHRVTISDEEGEHFRRGLENRSEANLLVSRDLALGSALTFDQTLQPLYQQFIYWTSSAIWALGHNLHWNTQSSWSYNRNNQVRNFWVDTIVDYRYRSLIFKLQAREEFRAGRETRSIFVNFARIIGSSGAIR